jgi:hypothetical protein
MQTLCFSPCTARYLQAAAACSSKRSKRCFIDSSGNGSADVCSLNTSKKMSIPEELEEEEESEEELEWEQLWKQAKQQAVSCTWQSAVCFTDAAWVAPSPALASAVTCSS